MKMTKIFMAHSVAAVLLILTISSPAVAGQLSPEAQKGEEGFALCHACHNPELNPPLAPPMWGVQRRYMMTYRGREVFITAITDFVRQPDKDKAVMKRPVEVMGLMPAQELPKDTLRHIAAYIFETSFPPPCTHWDNAVKKAEAQGNVDFHIRKDKMMLQRFCDR